MTFAFIRDHRDQFPVQEMCRTLGVSCSGYFAWRGRPLSARDRRREDLAGKVRAVHEEHRSVYGSPRVHRVLLARGERVCRNTVAAVMRDCGLFAPQRRRFRARTTDSGHAHPVAPNVLDRRFRVWQIDRVWLTDITYIPTDEGFLYLASVMDLCSRRVLGWSMADHLRVELVSEALRMALARRGLTPATPPPALLHHSDRGVQYACEAYQRLLRAHGIAVSMSRRGDCYDNAPKESFWGTLKTELVHRERFATRARARAAIFDYIEVFYNRRRLHSSLGYRSPEQFEAALT